MAFSRPGAFLPQPAPYPARPARLVEAAALTAAAGIIIAIAATFPNTGGNLLRLEQIPYDYAAVNVLFFACAVVGVGVAILLALLGRTFLGSLTLATVLIGYGFVLNGGSYPGSWFLPEDIIKPTTAEYTIDICGTNVQDAELWVNGVYLGKTPYVTTLEDFKKKVPYWPEPPKDFKTDKANILTYHPLGPSIGHYQRWIKLELPRGYAEPSRPPLFSSSEDVKKFYEQKRLAEEIAKRYYYPRLRYAGEWGLSLDNAGWGGGGGRFAYSVESHFTVLFPDRQKRLEALLNKARLADYHVGPEWFEALETYYEDAWLALRKAADDEPPMGELLDAWAAWHYRLDQAVDPESAWEVFQRICDEAESRRKYTTASVAGQAVKLLTPKLPVDRLVDHAMEIIRTTNAFEPLQSLVRGYKQFGYCRRTGGLYLGDNGYLYVSSGENVGPWQSPYRGLPVAQAIWTLNQQLRSKPTLSPNVIQQRIVPALICWHYDARRPESLLAAVSFGGPAIDAFLLRQKWRASAEQLPFEQQARISGKEINPWLYLLAYLNDAAGRKFHREHAGEIMNLADKLHAPSWGWERDLDFLFADPWLAKEYWTHYVVKYRPRTSGEALRDKWNYLLKMGDATTAEMFVEAWKETTIDWAEFTYAVNLLDQLDPPMQKKVVDALTYEIHRRPLNLQGFDDVQRKQLVDMLRDQGRRYDVKQIFKTLAREKRQANKQLWKNVPLWLEHNAPDSPLVEMLARSENPELRAMVFGALRSDPTPGHRALLAELLKDPDPKVRAEAEKVAAELKTLAAAPLREFTSDPAAFSP
ncbi:MAG: HEAT repeat domain-containing protein [Pirellulales bacterium]|nr:HEAT repeat domain-containing protein [Pirellulales bacterium]